MNEMYPCIIRYARPNNNQLITYYKVSVTYKKYIQSTVEYTYNIPTIQCFQASAIAFKPNRMEKIKHFGLADCSFQRKRKRKFEVASIFQQARKHHALNQF